MTTRRHLTALPKGTAFPVTTDLPDGYPFLRTDEGPTLYEWDLGTTAWVAITSSGGGGGSEDLIELEAYFNNEDDWNLALGTTRRDFLIPAVSAQHWDYQGSINNPSDPYDDVPSVLYASHVIDSGFVRTGIWSSSGTYAVYAEARVDGLVPGDVVELHLVSIEGVSGPVFTATCPPSRTGVVVAGQMTSAFSLKQLHTAGCIAYSAGSPVMKEYGIAVRQISLYETSEARITIPPLLATGLAVASTVAGEVNVTWTPGAVSTSVELALVDVSDNSLIYQATINPSSASSHDFYSVTTGLDVVAVITDDYDGAGQGRGAISNVVTVA